MEAPDNIYVAESLIKTPYGNEWSPTPYISRENTEYIRKDIVDEMLKTAEDHAFFAGQEKLRERLLEWAKEKANDYKGTANIGRSFELMIKKIESL